MIKVFIRDLLFILLLLSLVISSTNLYYAYKYPLRYGQIILNEASANNLDPDFITAIICEESRFNPRAISKSGALGLMQLMPATAFFMALEIGLQDFKEEDLFDPTTNIRIGTKYLRYLKDKFGALSTILAAYNAGEGRVSEWLLDPTYTQGQSIIVTTPYPQTNAYIENVLRTLKIYRNKRY